MAKLKTFRVLMAETHGQYYEVRAEDEEAREVIAGFIEKDVS